MLARPTFTLTSCCAAAQVKRLTAALKDPLNAVPDTLWRPVLQGACLCGLAGCSAHHSSGADVCVLQSLAGPQLRPVISRQDRLWHQTSAQFSCLAPSSVAYLLIAGGPLCLMSFSMPQ